MKKVLMLILDAILWVGTVAPIVHLFRLCQNAAANGIYPGLDGDEKVYGVSAFMDYLLETLIFGFYWVFLWGILLAITVLFTVFMFKFIKKGQNPN